MAQEKVILTNTCANCQKPVEMWFNTHTKRIEPISNYWKGTGNNPWPITEVYCSPYCSLEKHERERHGNQNKT